MLFCFQAEDGIRDWSVTGVQTCALPISSRRRHTRLVSDWSSDVCSSDLKRSRRSACAFVTVNCGALSAALVESELFGHVKGAFTGAIANRDGRFKVADGGTILLDEVGDLPPETQVKLLRVLQEHEFEPIGSNKAVKVNVRILAATNRNLEEDVRTGKFRSDLLYRLNVFPIHIPPLRERRQDIPMLVAFLVQTFAQ